MRRDLKNKEIRTAAEAAGVRLWEIAKEIGISDNTLTRRLRVELPVDEMKEYLLIIKRIYVRKKEEAEARPINFFSALGEEAKG